MDTKSRRTLIYGSIWLAIIISVIAIAGHMISTADKNESKNRDIAVSLVQNYGRDIGGPDTILTCLRTVLRTAESTGTSIERLGWYVSHVSGNVYRVGFAYNEWGVTNYVEWDVNINGYQLGAVDSMARTIKEMAELF